MRVTKQNDSVFRSWARCASWRTHRSTVSRISPSRLFLRQTNFRASSQLLQQLLDHATRRRER
jgi:hypothetical protein